MEKAHADETRTNGTGHADNSKLQLSHGQSQPMTLTSPPHCPLKLVVMLRLGATTGQDLRSAMSNPALRTNSPVSEGQWQGWAFAVFTTTTFLFNTLHSKKIMTFLLKYGIQRNQWDTFISQQSDIADTSFPFCNFIFCPLPLPK